MRNFGAHALRMVKERTLTDQSTLTKHKDSLPHYQAHVVKQGQMQGTVHILFSRTIQKDYIFHLDNGVLQ
jgi:hypothetical protein